MRTNVAAVPKVKYRDVYIVGVDLVYYLTKRPANMTSSIAPGGRTPIPDHAEFTGQKNLSLDSRQTRSGVKGR